MNVEEVGWQGIQWIIVAQDRGKWEAEELLATLEGFAHWQAVRYISLIFRCLLAGALIGSQAAVKHLSTETVTERHHLYQL